MITHATVHANNHNYSKLALKFFPPNTTAGTQPLDAGIIRNFKFQYRKYLMEFLIRGIDCGERLLSATETVKSVNVSQAISWLRHSWENVSKNTIIYCFRRVGFSVEITNEISEDINEDDWRELASDLVGN